MTTRAPSTLMLDDWFARELPELCLSWSAATAPAPRLLAFDDDLAEELGLDAEALRSPAGVDLLVGNTVVDGSDPVALAYAGHQFGGYSPRLGDGRALLLGELQAPDGRRWDLHLKGSGRTPFARGGDGFAAVGPMLREYLMGVAMHALGIPTTRALAVLATGTEVARERLLPGAVLARVAASHIRVGTFEYAWAVGGADLVRRLADHAIARHHPSAADADNRCLALLAVVADSQAALVARWMQVGFIHGVMNTDNMTISGETIDYGPCAFMDRYDPATVYSSIDSGGRYAYGNQPTIALWNLARFAESLLGVIDADPDRAVAAATAVLDGFSGTYRRYWVTGMYAKLGLRADADADADADAGADTDTVAIEDHDGRLVDDLMLLMAEQRVDMTRLMRSLSDVVRGDRTTSRLLFDDPSGFDDWCERWERRRAELGQDPVTTAEAMDLCNPVHVPRNHLVEAALAAATVGDMAPFDRLVAALREPFVAGPGTEGYELGAPDDFGPYRTFCGT